MNVHRAQEILAADEKIDVDLNGVSVWIDSVDSAKGLVKIHAEGNPADARVVPANELEEVH
ncbi:acid-soluble spore protein H [compost metagenome]